MDVSESGSPFRVGELPINQTWEKFNVLQTKVEWFNDLGIEGIICWVWNSGECRKEVAIITTYLPGNTLIFEANGGSAWEHATPIEPKECYLGGFTTWQ